MARRCMVALFFVLSAPAIFPQSQFVLVKSTLSYHMSHPIHQIDGTSTEAKGKGTCGGANCAFLIAAPVNTFKSGDSNRDLHMIEAVRGAQYPMVVVRSTLPNPIPPDGTLYADLEVQFAGQTAHYEHVAFQKSTSGKQIQITGTVPATCSDFKIDRPSFLTVPISNNIPVTVDMTWQAQ